MARSGETIGSRRKRSDTSVSSNPLPEVHGGIKKRARRSGTFWRCPRYPICHEIKTTADRRSPVAKRTASHWTTVFCQLTTAATKLDEDQSEPILMLSVPLCLKSDTHATANTVEKCCHEWEPFIAVASGTVTN